MLPSRRCLSDPPLATWTEAVGSTSALPAAQHHSLPLCQPSRHILSRAARPPSRREVHGAVGSLALLDLPGVAVCWMQSGFREAGAWGMSTSAAHPFPLQQGHGLNPLGDSVVDKRGSPLGFQAMRVKELGTTLLNASAQGISRHKRSSTHPRAYPSTQLPEEGGSRRVASSWSTWAVSAGAGSRRPCHSWGKDEL